MRDRAPFAAVLCLFASAGAARAGAFYVSQAGNDSNAGTLAEPFRTVQKGVAAAVSPGDAVYVRAGTYESREGILLSHSGKAGRPIVLANYPGESPVIRFVAPASGRYPRIEIANPAGGASAIGWLVIEGLEIAGGYEGIKFYNAHDLVIRGNDIHDSRGQGILGVSGLRVSIVKNKIRRNGDPADRPDDRTLRNKLHGFYGTGTDFSILDNVFDSNFSWGIQAAGYPYKKEEFAGPEYAGAARWRIAGNVFARGIHHGGIVIWQQGARDNVIENNLFYQNAREGASGVGRGIDFYFSGGGNVVRNNTFCSSSDDKASAITDTSGGASYAESGSRFDASPGCAVKP